jgi:hypothetical protein
MHQIGSAGPVFDRRFSLAKDRFGVAILRRFGSRVSAAIVLCCLTGAAFAEEPTREACDAAVQETRAKAEALPTDDVPRYFAERHLHQALVEAGNGEFDECIEAVERAAEELRDRPHALAPGERLNILQAHEIPQRR